MFGILVKQFTNCRLGMMSWGLTLMIAAAQRSGLSNAMFVCVTLQLLYIAKFFCWERGYLQTMDMAHDRAGFYICWGCLVWPPAVYSSPALYLVHHPHSLPAWAYTEATYESADGIQRVNLLLASGFGGAGAALPFCSGTAGSSLVVPSCSIRPFLTLFLLVFVTILLWHRMYRDEERCRRKYGKDWEAHYRKVPCNPVCLLNEPESGHDRRDYRHRGSSGAT